VNILKFYKQIAKVDKHTFKNIRQHLRERNVSIRLRSRMPSDVPLTEAKCCGIYYNASRCLGEYPAITVSEYGTVIRIDSIDPNTFSLFIDPIHFHCLRVFFVESDVTIEIKVSDLPILIKALGKKYKSKTLFIDEKRHSVIHHIIKHLYTIWYINFNLRK
jgi:hypothetical protein